MEVKNHLLFYDSGRQVTFKPSPNHGKNYTPKYLIMHYTAADTASSAINWMLDPKAKVSAHLHIDREGNIVQLVHFNVVAWHAGKSYWKGLTGLNSYSIGIELQNTGKQEYTHIQLQVAQEVAKTLVKHYGLEDILGHSDIAPGRKTDPGKQFPMAQFKIASGVGSNDVFKKTKTDLNLRAGAGVGFSVITVLPKGTDVSVISENDGWAKVAVCSNKMLGYVSKSYLE